MTSTTNLMGRRKTFAIKSAPDSSVDTPKQRKASDIAFPWHKLPVELKREIIAYLIPQKQSFKFLPHYVMLRSVWERRIIKTSFQEPRWSIHAREINSTEDWIVAISREPYRPSDSPPMARMLHTYASLLRVKCFADEVRGSWFPFLNPFKYLRLFTAVFSVLICEP
jgi:hypothetical protein